MNRDVTSVVRWRIAFLTLALFLGLLALPAAQARETPQHNPLQGRERIGQEKGPQPRRPDSLVVEPISTSLTPQDLAESLVGEGVAISNVTYTGANKASGFFTGGSGIIGFDAGVILTSGDARYVVGPNEYDNISSNNGLPGDAELTALAGYETNDASVLEFDFVPASDTVFFRFVFASDEYNEFVNTKYNDAFAFFINGSNCAQVSGDPITINRINFGNPYSTSPNSHPELFINNDMSDGGGKIDTEMDGLTKVLTCTATVNPGATNHMKLAIADASDFVFDSAVFLEAGSLTGERVLELTGLEVTQAIQNLENSVTLIQDKPAVVRAHVRSSSTTLFDVKARLIGRRNGQLLPDSPLAPSNPGGRITVLTSPNRAALNDSFYFNLPNSWLDGTVDLEFVGLTHQAECLDHANVDDDCKAQVTFHQTPVPQVRLIGLRWEDGGGTLHDPDSADYFAVVADIQAQYPIHRLNWDRPTELTVSGNPPDLDDVLIAVDNQRTMDGSSRIYYGLLVDHASGPLGLGYVPGSASVGYLREIDPTTAAHEMAHNFGRNHTKCSGTEGNVNTSYPYSNGWISQAQTGDNAFYGFHIGTQEIFRPNNGDLLGYCRPRWVSDYTYGALRTAILNRWPAVAAREATLGLAGDPAVLVSGMLPMTGVGSFASIYQLAAPSDIVAPASGPYAIRFEGAGGAVLATYPFSPQLLGDGGPEAMFSFLLPWNDATTKIVLLHEGHVLDERSATGPAPTVTLTAPEPGDVLEGDSAVVAWTASDEDLEFAIQYSPDGGATWLTQATGLSGTTYELSLDSLPGSENALLRILASDGFLTGVDESDGPFTVSDHAPAALITSPESGAIYVSEQLIILQGSGYDAEDGQLGDGALSWASDVDGQIGVGATLELAAESLTLGVHTITLTAADDDDRTGQATITIEVLAQDADLPKKLAVEPDSITLLTTTEGAAETWVVPVRNLGEGSIEWSASSDAAWITLSEDSGFTPADIVLTVDPAGLAPGVYHGVVTFTGLEAEDSPQIIAVELTVNPASYDIYLPSVTTP